jgi:hypothetical protein
MGGKPMSVTITATIDKVTKLSTVFSETKRCRKSSDERNAAEGDR